MLWTALMPAGSVVTHVLQDHREESTDVVVGEGVVRRLALPAGLDEVGRRVLSWWETADWLISRTACRSQTQSSLSERALRMLILTG